MEASFGRIVAEIQSVNRKYLEISVSLPREFSRFENEVRRLVGETASRGQIFVRVHILPSASSAASNLPDVKQLQTLQKSWRQLAKKLGYDSAVIDLPFLLQRLPLALGAEVERDFSPLKKCLGEALKHLLQMKAMEGKALAEDLKNRLKALEKMASSTETLAPHSVRRMREKLRERLAAVLPDGVAVDERLLRELALFAEKVDIAEELTRLASHISQFRALLASKEPGVGRKMDFLVQELGREINTLGSKSQEAEIARLVVDMKSELEKMREQIQNIE